MTFVRIDAPDDRSNFRRVPEADRVVAKGIEGPVHRIEHPEGIPSVQRINRLFESASHGIPNPPDSARGTYPCWSGIFRGAADRPARARGNRQRDRTPSRKSRTTPM